MAENETEESGNIYFDVPGGISSQYQFDNTIDPYSYAPVHSSYGIGSLMPIGYDQTQYAPLPTDYQTLRGVGESTPYNYNQYLTWGPSAYETEIVTGYDNFGNPIIERPGSSIPMQGYDDVEGYNWDLLPEHGPFYTDSPLVNPGMNAPSGEFVNSGVANVDMGIPGVLLGSNYYGSAGAPGGLPFTPGGASSAPFTPQNREGYTAVNGYLPALIGGGSWMWNPEVTRMGYDASVPAGRHGDRSGQQHRNLKGNWSYVDRHGNWVKSTELSDEQIATRPSLDDAIEQGYVNRTTGYGGLGTPVPRYEQKPDPYARYGRGLGAY